MTLLKKMLYGALFTVLFPAILFLIARHVDVPFSISHSYTYRYVYIAIIILSLCIMIAAMLSLVVKGKGLPMNAFPPKKLVTSGIFHLIPHPIYFSFSIIVIATSLYFQSDTGIFLVSPLVVLSTMALVYGYENIYLKKVFGHLPKPIFRPLSILSSVLQVVGVHKGYRFIVAWANKKANSWKCYKIGSVRIMNHALYSGVAGGVLAALIVLLTDSKFNVVLILLMLLGIIGAATIGQLLVGSTNKLNRPFGYFGAMILSTIAGIVLMLINRAYIELTAAVCLSATIAQAIGRVRCLIQGCCHGNVTDSRYSIKVSNKHSRVCMLSDMCNVNIHPTPLYSIMGNVVLFILLLIFWQSSSSYSLIIGVYFIGAGLIRFVEEAYRGEPLTKIIYNLRIYQWFAVFMYLFGLAFLFVPSAKTTMITLNSLGVSIIYFIVFFIVCAFSMSVDFPDSNMPFSKLSG